MTTVEIDNTNNVYGRVVGIQLKGFDNGNPKYIVNTGDTPDERGAEFAMWILRNSLGNATVSDIGIVITEIEWLYTYTIADNDSHLNLFALNQSLTVQAIDPTGIRIAVDFELKDGTTMRVTSKNFHAPTLDDI